MEWAREQQAWVERRRAWQRLELRARQQRVSQESRALVVQERIWSRTEPIRREQLSPRPESRAGRPSASVHLPATGKKAI